MVSTDKNTQDPARDEILSLDHLPPLAFATVRLIELASDPDLEIAELASVIELDPPLTARVLSLANSAYFGQRTPIVSVRRAIVQVLGLDKVRSLCLVMALAGSFNTRRCRDFNIDDYWLHALLTATVAAAIARRVGNAQELPIDSLYLCGLLHNIGVLVLVHVRPVEMSRVHAAVEKDRTLDRLGVEQDLLGIDHRQAGEWLAFNWHLPEVVVRTLGNIADPGYQGEHAAVVDIVRAASRWADDCLSARESTLSVAGVAEETSHAVQEEVLGRLQRLRALAGAFTQRAPV